MRWITRENIKVDRVACPWLIKRFVDPAAEFLFVPEAELLASAKRESAIPFDATRFPEVRLNHRGVRCTFEAILDDFNLTDPTLHQLGEIVRAADVKGQEHVTPEGPGLRAIAEGFAAVGVSDAERLRLEFPIYDALYAYVRQRDSTDVGGRRNSEDGMRMPALVTAAAVLLTSGAAETVTFDTAPTGKPPAGWTAGQTGSGQVKWTVEADDTAPSRPNVLKPSGQATYAVCIKDAPNIKDGFVEVKFKPISGREDQAGGLVWRAKDANNYYIARANALEDNVTIYHTINGRRTEKKRTNMKVSSNQWHTLRVDFQGNHFTVTFDGKKAIEWDDDTFRDAGKIGVWTKADSVTLFDDFSFSGK